MHHSHNIVHTMHSSFNTESPFCIQNMKMISLLNIRDIHHPYTLGCPLTHHRRTAVYHILD